jgi:DNA-binding NtrC family response regulator
VTAQTGDEIRRRALRAGAVAFVPDPIDTEVLLGAVRSALRARESERLAPGPEGCGGEDVMSDFRNDGTGCGPRQEGLEHLIGTAPAFRSVVGQLPTLARTDAVVLITGETGTGKELVAHALHRLGPRADRPFMAVNCGALVDTLLEGELFGHERGAFTDAHARRQGLIVQAAGGTVFLDEAEALSPRAQVALLRVLQEHTVRPLGSTAEQRVDVRFLAATNVSLERLVQSGRFRVDLYYRLCVFAVNLPALRERREDILPLAEFFIAKHVRGALAPKLSPCAEDALLAYDWPGNVRELESAIVRAVHVAREGSIRAGDLGLRDARRQQDAQLPAPSSRSYKLAKREVLDAFERQYLTRLMKEHGGNVTRAAHTAGKERRDLGKLLKRHGLDPRRFGAETFAEESGASAAPPA